MADQGNQKEMATFSQLQEEKKQAQDRDAVYKRATTGIENKNILPDDLAIPDIVAQIEGRGMIGKQLKKWSAACLKFGWEWAAPSWGCITILAVDLVMFAQWIFGKEKICQLGYEWIPPEIAKNDPTKAKIAGEKLRTVETAGCACLNCTCGLIIIGIIVVVAIIVDSWVWKGASWVGQYMPTLSDWLIKTFS